MTRIALVDDHVLLRNGLRTLLTDLGYDVVLEAANGDEMRNLLPGVPHLDVALLDVNMPVMDGFQTAAWLRQHQPAVKVLTLSMYDDEQSIMRMLRAGARGYVLKDSEPEELKAAIDAVHSKGFYYSDMVTSRIVHNLQAAHAAENKSQSPLDLNDKETQFIKLACTELTYKAIAERMNLSPRTIDGYRDALFEKLDVKSRVGLVLFAIKNGLYKMQ